MHSPLTDFGQHNLAHLLRLRIWMVLVALGVALPLQLLIPGYPLGGLLFLIFLELVISILAALLEPHLASRLLVHLILCLDVATFTAGVFVTGGTEGGLSALYGWVVLTAALLLGLSSVPLYSLLVLCGFGVNVLLEFAGIRMAVVSPLPLTVVIMAQLVLLCMLLVLGYTLAHYRHEIAEQRTRESEGLEQSARETSLIFDTLRATTSTLELDQVIERLLEKLVRALNVTSAYFTLVNEADQTGTISQEFFAETAAAAERDVGSRTYPLANSAVISTMLTGITTVTQVDDPALAPAELRAMEEGAGKTVLRVPLRTTDQVIGFLSLWESRKRREWTAPEIRLVETIAAHTTIALANARSYAEARSRTRELEALYASSQRLNASLSVDEICHVGVDSLIDSLGYDHVAVYFTTPQMLVLQYERGFAKPIPEIPITNGIMARSARIRRPVLVDDVSTDTDFISAMPDVLSEICVPLIHNEQVFGILNVETIKPHRLSSPDVRLLTTFANQLVIAFDNVHLFQEIQQRLAELETLHQASAAINADLTLDAVLRRVGDYFINVLAVDTCTICGWDATNEQLYVLLDRDPDAALHVPMGTRFVARGIAYTRLPVTRGKPYILNRHDPQIDPQLAGELDHHRWTTLLILPLLGKGKPIGIALLGIRDRARRFYPDELRLAESLAGQAAIAIENARLYAEAAERLRENEQLYERTRQDAEVKSALLRELSHRVKNNLSAVTSLLQLALIEPAESREQILFETLARAQSMVLAHGLLARSERARVNLVELGGQVLQEAVLQLAPRGSRIAVAAQGQPIEISLRQLTTVALVLNELATNAIMHGLAESHPTDGAQLDLYVQGTPGGVRLTLSDNGKGLPGDFDLRTSHGLGLGLIRTLAEKDLHGSFSLERCGDRTVATLQFALEE